MNPSDLMTKHVDIAHIEHYMSLLNLKFEVGRADIAQQLHVLEGSESPSAGRRKVLEAKTDNVHGHVRPVSFVNKSGGGLEPSSGRSKHKS